MQPKEVPGDVCSGVPNQRAHATPVADPTLCVKDAKGSTSKPIGRCAGRCIRYAGLLLCAVFCLFVVVVLMHPLLYRFERDSGRLLIDEEYLAPVHYVEDHGPLRNVLLDWAALWDMRDEFEQNSAARRSYERKRDARQ
jgi:hypothetical protein